MVDSPIVLYRFGIDINEACEGAKETYQVSYREFKIVRESKSNYWIETWPGSPRLKRVTKNPGKKGYAHTSLKMALVHFKSRTKMRTLFLKRDLSMCEEALKQAKYFVLPDHAS